MKWGSFLTFPGSQIKFLLCTSFLFLAVCTLSLAQEKKITGTVIMDSSALQLDEIVVTSFGIRREKKALAYAAQNIGAEELAQVRDLNVINSLAGKVAGLELIKSSSGVGAPSRVIIRGNRSIFGNNQPLYIVDGAPISNYASTPDSEWGGIAEGDGIGNITPEDIEGITVLKGPSATALYGSRANNGAIVITTKKGTSGKGIGAEYSLDYSVETPVVLTRFQNVYGQGSSGQYYKHGEFGWGPKMEGQMVEHWTPDPNSEKAGTTYPFVAHPDNFRDFFRMGTNLTNSLALSAGNDATQAYFSYTNTQSGGIVQGNNLRRNNFNLRVTSEMSKRLNLDSRITYFHQDVDNRVSTGDDYANPIRALYRQPGNISMEEAQVYQYYDIDGFLLQNYWNPHSGGGENPWWLINRIPREESRDRVLGMGSLKYEIADGLSLMVRTAFDYISDSRNQKMYNDTYNIADRGDYTTGISHSSEMNSDLLLNYNKTLADNWSINVSAGGNMLVQKWYYLNTADDELLKPNLFTVGNAFRLTSTEDGATKKLNSLYGFATLGFRNWLFLDLTARNDWSSTLPPESWSYFYPSAGVTWVISEMFKESIPGWLTFAKIRASLARVGNDTDPYQLDPVYYFSQGGSLGYATRGDTKPAANLKPEITTSQELGFDIRFFRNRAGLDLTWYKSNSKNQLLNVPMPIGSGYTDQFMNAGNIQNSGVEATLNLRPAEGKFTWDIAFNFAQNNSLVKELSEGLTEYTIRGRATLTTVKVVVGSEYGDIYTKGFERNEDGRILINWGGIPITTYGQTELMGNYNPDWIGGIRNTFTYKGFDLSFIIDIRQGGDIFSFTEANLASDGFSDYTLESRGGMVVDGVNQIKDEDGNVLYEVENTTVITAETYWQSLGGRNNPTGEAFKYDASNIRMREAAIGYTKNFTSSFVRSLRLSFAGRNLFFITNKAEILDPIMAVGTTNIQGTVGFELPGTRSVGMNLKVTF